MFPLSFKDKSFRQGVFAGGTKQRVSLVTFAMLLFFLSCYVHAKETDAVPAAVRWYQEMAAQGDVEAKYNLGMMNETGWSVPVDIEKAIRWYRDAANDGHAEAQLRLGMIYYLGLGSYQSKIKGESWIRKAANQGNKFAKELTEKLFSEDLPVSVDRGDILAPARKTYLENNKKASAVLAQLINDASKKAKASEKDRERTTIKERRESRISSKGIGSEETVKKTREKGKRSERIKNILPEFVGDETLKENRTLERGNIGTIRFQAKKGEASAQYNLGRMYELGVKIPVDKKLALAWYEKAAAQGFADAEYRLAITYLYGINADKNEGLGMKWLSAAARHGHQVAKTLQEKLETNEGLLLPNQSIAIKWYLERAVAGDAESAYRLGKIFQYGWGVEPDLREAVKWYKRASLQGYKDAGEALQKVDVVAVRNGKEDANFQSEGVMSDSQPSSWIAYLLAFAVAILIFFWPAISKKRKNKSESMIAVVREEEPPFS